MTIQTVQTSNTFNEFRQTTNLAINEVNKLSDGTGNLVIDSITANTFVGVSSDLNVFANTGNDVISLLTDNLIVYGTNGISTSISSGSNTLIVNLTTTGVTANTYGSATKIPVIAVNSQGRVTSATTVNVAGVSNFQYYSSNANFVLSTADGGSYSATIGQHLGSTASVTFKDLLVTGNVALSLNASNVASGTLSNARTTANTSNSASTIVARDAAGSFSANVITATLFSGSGASLTNIPNSATTASSANGASTIVARDAAGSFSASVNANIITSGTIATARLASGTANSTTYLRGDQTWSAIPDGQTSGSTTVGYLNYNGTTSQAGQIDGGTSVPDGTTRLNYNGYFYATRFYGDGSNVLLINANNISSGTLSNARTTANTSNSASTIVARDAAGSFSANVITANTFSGNANASIITSGTIETARLASGTANSTTYLRGDQTWAVVSSGATITDDTSNNNTFYVGLASVTSGSWTQAYVSSTKLYFNANTGTLSATNLNSLSDLRLKEEVEIIENAVSTVSKINGVKFKWKENNRKSYGVIAQELEKILPELVEGENIKTVNYGGLIAFLINAVKELDDRIRKLES